MSWLEYALGAISGLLLLLYGNLMRRLHLGSNRMEKQGDMLTAHGREIGELGERVDSQGTRLNDFITRTDDSLRDIKDSLKEIRNATNR